MTKKTETATKGQGSEVATVPTMENFTNEVLKLSDAGEVVIPSHLFEMAEQIDTNELQEITTDYKVFVEGEKFVCIFRGIHEDKIVEEETGEEKIKKVVVLEDKNGKKHVNGGAVLISTFSRNYDNNLNKLFRIDCTGQVKAAKGKYFTFEIFQFGK